jgi:hypothetical protein
MFAVLSWGVAVVAATFVVFGVAWSTQSDLVVRERLLTQGALLLDIERRLDGIEARLGKAKP